MTTSTARLYLEGAYVAKNPGYHTEDSPWKAEQVSKMIQRHGLQPRRVGEVGCGAGEILRQLQLRLPEDTEFTGYEISPQAAALAEPRRNPRLRFRCEDLLTADVEPFDLLLCLDVFEHVEDYRGFLGRLRSLSGRFIFHIPLDLSAQMLLRGEPLLRVRQEVGHLHYFTKDTALATLRETGYEVADWVYTPTQLELHPSWRTALLKWPRKIAFALEPDLGVRFLGGYSLLVLAGKGA